MCYLQHAGADFQGGTFQFACADGNSGSGSRGGIRDSAIDGSRSGARPVDVLAAPGRVVAYDAHEEHGVTPVTGGERFALTLWFTSQLEHCEDTRLLAAMAGGAAAEPPGDEQLLHGRMSGGSWPWGLARACCHC